MFRYSYARITLILTYFLICSACGAPRDDTSADDQPDSQTSTASDINFIGGGSQLPDPVEEERPYDSPMIDTEAPPTRLNWSRSIRSAIRAAGERGDRKIIVWFTNPDCVECQAVEQDVFTHEDVLANSKRWIFVRLDTDQSRDQAQYYLHGSEPPALVFLDQRGNEYRRFHGTVTVEEFVNMLIIWF